MVKYLHQLLADIAFSIEMSSQLPEMDWVIEYEDGETESSISASKLMGLPAVCNIPAEAFPPEKLLTDIQVAQLNDEILRMWSSWRVWASVPPNLTERQKYSALVHAMQHELVSWSFVKGGDLNVCQFETGTFCPFGADGGSCYCKALDESVRHDLAIWEEHVRSQGLDPYLELTEEEGAAFESAKRNRNLPNQNGDDWLAFDQHENAQSFERLTENVNDIEADMADEDWVRYIFSEDFGRKDDANSSNNEGSISDDLF